ncbi:MAG: YggT family protein [Anaerolineales bacterium]|nr:YggT family protein [Anaerolineales bacterium]MCK5634170.1 YggT family protein [Anaerolineales bacterium]
MTSLANAIEIILRAFTLGILADVLVGYFLDVSHPIRQFLDSIVQPFLAPIRKLLPPAGGLDFSPLVLFFLVELIRSVLVGILV